MQTEKYSNSLFVSATLIVDTLLCVLLYGLFLWHFGVWGTRGAKASMAIVGMTYLFVAYTGGVILFQKDTRNWQIPFKVFKNVVKFAVFTYVIFALSHIPRLSLKSMALFMVCVVLVSSVYRLFIHRLVLFYRSRDKHMHKVVLVGSTENNLALYQEMKGMPSLGYQVMGYFDHTVNDEFPKECVYLGKPEDVEAWLANHRDVHGLYCCLPSRDKEIILSIIHYCVNNLVDFCSVPNVRNYLHNRMYFNMIGSVPYLSLYVSPLASTSRRWVKRMFDICFSLAFLCTLFPIIFIVVAIVTKLTMPGPIFFRQKRNGLNGNVFYCLKFRSMRVNADADRMQATKNDPRKTKWGNILRKTNIDETPQFINVLLGDMSVVGPRPHMQRHTDEYSKLIDKYMMRHLVKPGITGWSQVTGFRGETQELWQMEGRVKGDIWYIEHWSFGLDIFIIYKTIANVIKGDKQAF